MNLFGGKGNKINRKLPFAFEQRFQEGRFFIY